ncbi:MAG: hypothetical protein ACJ79S_17135 [Gemmatimonadaceae bacterium]
MLRRLLVLLPPLAAERVDAYVRDAIRRHGVIGLSVGVTICDRPVLVRGYGLASLGENLAVFHDQRHTGSHVELRRKEALDLGAL